jgi:hypothetical protein
MVVQGEPGVGKSALVHDLVSAEREAPDGKAVRVLCTAGVESESPLPFAALHRLLRPVVNFERLPVPQARSLRGSAVLPGTGSPAAHGHRPGADPAHRRRTR